MRFHPTKLNSGAIGSDRSGRVRDRLYCEALMSEESTRNWTRTYLIVIAVEILTLAALWLLQRHYGT